MEVYNHTSKRIEHFFFSQEQRLKIDHRDAEENKLISLFVILNPNSNFLDP